MDEHITTLVAIVGVCISFLTVVNLYQTIKSRQITASENYASKLAIMEANQKNGLETTRDIKSTVSVLPELVAQVSRHQVIADSWGRWRDRLLDDETQISALRARVEILEREAKREN